MNIAVMVLTLKFRKVIEMSRILKFIFWRDESLLSLRVGRWRWPWAVLGTLLSVLSFVAIGFGLFSLAELFGIPFFEGNDAPFGFYPSRPVSFLEVAVAFSSLFLAPFAVVWAVHGLSWRSVFSFDGDARLADFTKAALACFFTLGATTAILYAASPQSFRLRWLDPDHVAWMSLALYVILIQTSAEEVYIKGYITRIWVAILPYPVFVSMVMLTIFIVMHFDNDVFRVDFWGSLIGFASIWWMTWWLQFRSRSIVGAIGWHWSNNVFGLLCVVEATDNLSGMSLFVYTDTWIGSGRSNVTNPLYWLMIAVQTLGMWALLFWSRSPLYISPANVPVPSGSDSLPEVGTTGLTQVGGGQRADGGRQGHDPKL